MQQPQAVPQVVVHQQPPVQNSQAPQPQQEQYLPDLSPEEIARREKVRAAARDRQRKHRALVKQRRLRELGLDMGNEIIPGMEEAHYRAPPDGQYHQVLPPELQQLAPPPQPPIPHEPPFPQGAPLGGDTFASTLLLSFSCAPLLKQHLLRTLGMTNEELASLEPIIAEAWDRWDHQVGANFLAKNMKSDLLSSLQRRLHYAEVVKNGGQPPPLPPPFAVDLSQHDPHGPPPGGPFPHANGPGPSDPSQQAVQAQAQAAQAAAAANDFRARFHRSIVAPTPFQTAGGTATSSASTTATTEGAIDPHLATNSGANGIVNSETTAITANGMSKSKPVCACTEISSDRTP